MHELLNASMAPEPAQRGSEPVSSGECEWILDAAQRFAARGMSSGVLIAHLEAIAAVLANGGSALVPAALFDDLEFADPVNVLASGDADGMPAEVPEPDDAGIGISFETIAHAPEVEPQPAGPVPAEANPDIGAAPSAFPLFPRGASSQQRRKGARSRSRANRPAAESPDEASLQMALPLESDGRARNAVSDFAERMLRARERLVTDEPTTSMGASGDVLSFAERLKKVRERLAGEDVESGRASG